MPFFERLFGLFDLPDESMRSGQIELPSIKSEIAFDDVVFAYSGSTNALDGLSVRIRAGQTVAFVGPTGSGKSTITKVLPTFYDPQHGRIAIDGVDVREFDIESLRARIAMVSQETCLFNDTIAANIRYARLDASDEDIAWAIEAARLSSVIGRLPLGLETVVGDRGAKLSGGERQRVAVARALLQDADVLILDEATSALDSETEALFQAAIRGAMRERTCIVVAHRLSTIVDVNLICVVAEGRIVESGAHHELLERRGHYARLWGRQTAAAS